MKKFIVSVIFAISLFVIAQGSYACENQFETPLEPSEIRMTKEKVSDVIYENGWFYLITELDDNNGFWVLDAIKLNDRLSFNDTIESLKDEYINKFVVIQYYSDCELLSWYVSD